MKTLTTLLLALLVLSSCSDYESFDECYLKEQQQCSGVEGLDCVKTANKFCMTKFSSYEDVLNETHTDLEMQNVTVENSDDNSSTEENLTSPDLNENEQILEKWKEEKNDTKSIKNSVSNLPDCKNNFFHNCYGTWTYSNGDIWTGEFSNGDPFGKGTLIYSNGIKITGIVNGSTFNGYAKVRFADGRTYEGNLKDNRFHGLGTYTWNDGQKYTGQFYDGQIVQSQQQRAQGNNDTARKLGNLGRCLTDQGNFASCADSFNGYTPKKNRICNYKSFNGAIISGECGKVNIRQGGETYWEMK